MTGPNTTDSRLTDRTSNSSAGPAARLPGAPCDKLGPMKTSDPGFPAKRPRRLRHHPRLRDRVREHRLNVDDLVYPLFLYHGRDVAREIPSMPGQYQYSLDRLPDAIGRVVESRVPAVLLFGIPATKDTLGTAA